jgi:multisubunit Na+/H+ antiporter MnhE subunit
MFRGSVKSTSYPTPFASFPLHFPVPASSCVITFQLVSTLRDGLVLSLPLHDVTPQKLHLKQRLPKIIYFFILMFYSYNLFLFLFTLFYFLCFMLFMFVLCWATTQIYYAILQTEYSPRQCKVGQIITIVKPGKSPNDITSYRPIGLLQILSKILEKIHFLND